MQFTAICQKLIDAWLFTGLDVPSSPEDIYSNILDLLNIRMRLSVIELDSEEPKNWLLRTVRHSRISNRIINLDSLFKGGKLGELKDQTYVESSVLPAYIRAIRAKQPTIDSVETRLAGVRVVYDRIILPHRAETPEWLVVCTHGRFMASSPPQQLQLDAEDEAIVTGLMRGLSAKEIAGEVGLSPRTIEHRLEKIKKQMGARSLPHLAALIVTAGFERSIRHVSDD